MPLDHKRCITCDVSKKIIEFGVNKRYSDGHQRTCKQCWNIRNTRWRQKNPAAATEHVERWRVKNYQRWRAKSYAWRVENPERVKAAQDRANAKRRDQAIEISRKWRQDNPEQLRAQGHIKRARKQNAAGTATAEQIAARAEVWGNKCWICGGSYESDDHVIALSKGGSNWPANLRPACLRCNTKKRNQDWRKWVKAHPRPKLGA